ncbi:MAG: sigma-70 family RNA polymerase sigma factor [Ruminococcaceae bacterium]|nr:sigma-70 family RNA polymerase sigma factor [Oscillospiraceae bacterium]
MKEQQQKILLKGREHLSDDEIVELYWNRNEKAIAATDDKYRGFLFTIAYNIVHDHQDCEECINDTYLGTWNRIPPTRPNVFQAFLSRIMRNIAVNRYKYNTADKRIPSELTVSLEELEHYMRSDMSIEEELAIKQLGDALNGYLYGLSERDRLIFMSRYYYADKVIEIADMLNISRNTVTKYLESIREGLKEHLIKEGVWHE